MRRGFFGQSGGAAASPPKPAQKSAGPGTTTTATPQKKKTATTQQQQAATTTPSKLEVAKGFRVVPLPKDEDEIVRRAQEAVAKDALSGAYALARRFALGSTVRAPLDMAKRVYWDMVKAPKEGDTDLALLEHLLAFPCLSDTALCCEESGVRRSKKPRTADVRELPLDERVGPALGWTDRSLPGDPLPRRLATLAGEHLWSVYFCAPATEETAIRGDRAAKAAAAAKKTAAKAASTPAAR